MSKGSQLLLSGQYQAAIPLLEAEARKDKQDDFRVGAALDVGVAHILAHDFTAARKVLVRLQDESLKTVSLHCIYLGMIDWLQGRYKKAVDAWVGALDCAYCRDKGMDGALLMFYASVRRPKLFAVAESLALVKSRLVRLNDKGLAHAVARLAINEGDEATARACAMDARGRNASKRMNCDLALVQFYSAVRSMWVERDEAAYRARMNACVLHSMKAIGVDFEFVLARREVELI